MFISAPAVFFSLLALISSVAGAVTSSGAARGTEECAVELPQGTGDASEFLKRGDDIVDVFSPSQVRREPTPSKVRAVNDEKLEKWGPSSTEYD
ncbi:hypothetical protein PAXINDRAFT_13718 [Paxillus involutus ATCC 200175]|uniref:Extracellular metalloproteinase n=1 Tax=Paxillus involutus ATCC 200175 TaxID=664439 RepID=A0A0C9U0V9_PAXIN|nr:hypothetical protein PAXINDRAFT_13718 [Paxillus involutus ATCC 200175]